MAKINRYDGNLLPFAKNFTGGNRTIFGETTQSDDLTDNINTKFLQGWEATTDANTFPTKQDFNAVSYVSTALASYLHQVGIPEWNAKQEYHENSFVNFNGGLYRCKTNNHISITDPASDSVNWEDVLGNFVAKTGDETIDGIKTFTSSPTAPTPTAGDNSTNIATTAFVNAEIENDVGVANSTLVKTALNASGTAPIYACRAWVNFNGTGTVAIRASGNVSSITDNATGNYTVNFTTAMPDANYSIAVCGGETGSTPIYRVDVLTPTSFRTTINADAGVALDMSTVVVSVIR